MAPSPLRPVPLRAVRGTLCLLALAAALAAGCGAPTRTEEEPTGTLKIGSTPTRCVVHLAGRRYAKVEPVLTLAGMPAGTYRVRFDADGDMLEKEITLAPGGLAFVFGNLRDADANGDRRRPPSDAPTTAPPRSESAGTSTPGRSIPDADDAFHHAEMLRTALNPFAKRERYEEALRLYRKVLDRWPESDKAEACRYQIANIHESAFLREYETAIATYETVLTANPATALPVRWRIAVLYDNRLQDLPAALDWYERCAAESFSEENREQAARRAVEIRARLAEN